MNRTSKYKTLFSTTAIFAVSTVLSKLVLSLLLPLYTRMLTAEQYGAAELLTTISQLVMPVCSLAIQDSVFRFSIEYSRTPENVLRNAVKVASCASGVLLMVSIGLNCYQELNGWGHYFWLISVLTMFRAIFSLYANATSRTTIYAVDNVLYNGTLAVANVVYLTIFRMELSGYFLAMVTANVLSIAYLLWKCGLIAELKKSQNNKELLRAMLRYSAPLILNSISWGLTNVVNRVMLAQYGSSAATGIYSAASKIPSLLSMVVSVFSSALSLSVVRDYESEKDVGFYQELFNILHIGASLCAACIMMVNNTVFPFILGEDFAEATRYVPVLLMGTVFLSYTNYYSSIFSAMKKSELTMYSSFGGCLLNLLLNYFLIPKIGIMGACLATASSYVLIAIFRMVFCQIYFPIKFGFLRWVVSLVLLLVQAFAVTVDVYAAAISAGVIVVIFVFYWKEMIALMHMFLGFFRKRGKTE